MNDVMKKVAYHGGFAALGISLLMGMAALQTKPGPTLGNPSYAVSDDDLTESLPELPETAPVTMAAVPKVKARANVAVMALVELDRADAFRISATGQESSTRKTFSTTPNGIRNASAYATGMSRPVIEAQISGSWAAVSVNQFKKYVSDAVGD